MIRVLLMIDDAIVGGGQQHVLWLAEGLERAKFEVAVACAGEGYLVDELRRRGITVHPVRMSNVPGIRSFSDCIRLFRRWKPDIVHTHGGTAGFLARVCSVVSPAGKLVHSYHGIHYLHNLKSPKNRFYKLVDRVLKRLTDRLVCVAQSDLDLGIRHGVADIRKTVIIRYGIDTERFVAAATETHPAGKARKVVGTIGRLHVQKGHRYLIEAAAMVIKTNPSVIFRIVGEGELRNELQEQIKALGLHGHVQLLGARTDIPQLLADMDIFVLPSLWEGLPIVLLEAMAARKPIVVSAVDGVMEAVRDGQEALLFPSKDSHALAAAICRLLSDDALATRISKNARERVVREFGIRPMVRQIETLYESLLER